jgi:hypothetical protein
MVDDPVPAHGVAGFRPLVRMSSYSPHDVGDAFCTEQRRDLS